MSTFDYIADARTIVALLQKGQDDWKARIEDAITSGSTGSEILMALRHILSELIKSKTKLSSELQMRIKNFIGAANEVLMTNPNTAPLQQHEQTNI